MRNMAGYGLRLDVGSFEHFEEHGRAYGFSVVACGVSSSGRKIRVQLRVDGYECLDLLQQIALMAKTRAARAEAERKELADAFAGRIAVARG